MAQPSSHMDQSPPSEETLFAHAEWVQGVVKAMVRDEDLAQDIAQDALEAGLKAGPKKVRDPRAWLMGVVRNLHRQDARTGIRRRGIEERKQHKTEEPDSAELLERLEVQQIVARAVMELPDPFRSVLILRFYEGAPIRVIAARRNIKREKAESQVRRGLTLLHRLLKGRLGETWAVAVLPLALPATAATAATTTAVSLAGAISTKALFGVATCVLALIGLAIWEGPWNLTEAEFAESASHTEAAAGADSSVTQIADEASAPASSSQRTAIETPSEVASKAARSRILRATVEGLSEADTSLLEITVRGHVLGGRWPDAVQESWSMQGPTQDFDLEPFFARVAAHSETLQLWHLEVEIDHPNFLSETVRIAHSRSVELENGQVLYEARVQFAEVYFWPEFTLIVRDAHTREHLNDVELQFVPTAYMGLMQQPEQGSPYTVLGEGLSSPIALMGGRKAQEREGWVAGIALPGMAGELPHLAELAQEEEAQRGVVVYAGAPGYAWSSAVIDVSTGSEREILLEPGSALNVELTNVRLEGYAAIEKEAWLYISQLDEDGDQSIAWAERLDESLESDGFQIGELQPGRYAVSVELGEVFQWLRKRTVLARQEVLLLGGESHDLALHLGDSPEPPDLANLTGVLSFPSFDGEEDVNLEFYGSDFQYGDPDVALKLTDMQRVAGSLPSWSFQLDDLPLDTYQVTLSPLQEVWMVDHTGDGPTEIELFVPELTHVEVEVVDAQTGERIPLETIRYGQTEVLAGQVNTRGVVVTSGDDPGRFNFWTVPGETYVRSLSPPSQWGYGIRQQNYLLGSDSQAVRFELSRLLAIQFEFRDDGAALPHGDSMYYDVLYGVNAVNHDGQVTPIAAGYVEVSADGEYEISFEGVGEDRFLPIPPRRVVVLPGEPASVVVDLQRK